MREECARIKEGTCKKRSECNNCKIYKDPKKEEKTLPYGYGIWGGQIRDLLPHGARYYIH